jgi:CrcB protein
VFLAVERGAAVPRATLAVNVLGSFVLGVLVAADPAADAALFVGVGLCGAFTTFSTFSVETVDAMIAGRYRVAAANATLNLVGALLAIGLAGVLVAWVGVPTG